VPAPQRKQTIALSAISVPQLLHRMHAAYQKDFTTGSRTVADAGLKPRATYSLYVGRDFSPAKSAACQNFNE
jgi:hypothetical protein